MTLRTLSLAILLSTAVARPVSGKVAVSVSGRSSVRVGDVLRLEVTVGSVAQDTPTRIDLLFHGPRYDSSLGVDTSPEHTNYELRVKVSASAEGTWSVSKVALWFGDQKEPLYVPVFKYVFNVAPNEPRASPSDWDSSLNAAQIELLRKAADTARSSLETLKNNVATQDIPNNGALKKLLQLNVALSVNELLRTESRFHAASGDQGLDQSSIPFSDLHVDYKSVERSLNTKWIDIIVKGAAAAKSCPEQGPNRSDSVLISVSYRVSRMAFKEPAGAKQALAQKLIKIAQDLLAVMQRHMEAYEVIADAERVTFDLRLSSVPKGAQVSYFRTDEPVDKAPCSTECGLTLPFALWTFDFNLEGYRKESRQLDPYSDRRREFEVDFKK